MALLHKMADSGGQEDEGPEILHFRSINSLLDGPDDAGGGDRGERALALLLGTDSPRSSIIVQDRRPPRLPLHAISQEEYPTSPEVAQTPRSLVPAPCFPPHHTASFASYSERGSGLDGSSEERVSPGGNAGGGGGGGASGSGGVRLENAFNDLVNSFTNISIGSLGSLPSYQSGSDMWTSELNGLDTPRNRNSYCGGGGGAGGGGGGGSEPGARVAWTGMLPPRCTDTHAGFSPKVFLGGLPWDITEEALMQTFRDFHPLRVEWPGKDGRTVCGNSSPRSSMAGSPLSMVTLSPRGYVYMTFESERRVRALLAASRRDQNDNWYYRVSSRKMRHKEVQVIPWAVADSNFVVIGSQKLDPSRTVFVGALHGMLCARALATIMQDLFDGVVYAGIDTDKNKYPIGSGRVTFNNRHSYIRAVNAAFIEIRTDKFNKKVQVDPYLDDSMCSMCNMQGPYFCRDPSCFNYFCRACWGRQHKGHGEDHKALTRHKTGSGTSGGSGGSNSLNYATGAIGHPSAPVGALNGPSYTNGPIQNGPTYNVPQNGPYTNGPNSHSQNGPTYTNCPPSHNGPVYANGPNSMTKGPAYANGPVGASTGPNYSNGPVNYTGQNGPNYSGQNGLGSGQKGSNFESHEGNGPYCSKGPIMRSMGSNYPSNEQFDGSYLGKEAGYSSASYSPPGSSRSTTDSY